MNKRDFLKTSGAILTGSMLSRFPSAEADPDVSETSTASPAKTPEVRSNWGGNLHYSTDKLITPANLAEVQQAVKSTPSLRTLGSRHSFNRIADSSVEQLSVKNLSAMNVDAQARTVTVGGGVTYSELAPYLESQGFALHNLASLPHVTVAGACATATPGSGIHNCNLTTAVSAMEMVAAHGPAPAVLACQRRRAFSRRRRHLGRALGVITSITLDIQPTFQMARTLYENLSLAQLEKNLDAIFSSGYQRQPLHRLAAQPSRPGLDQTPHRARRQTRHPGPVLRSHPRHPKTPSRPRSLRPVLHRLAQRCRPWYDRMPPHFKIGYVPSAGAEIQSGFFVSRDRGYAAICAVEELRDRITPTSTSPTSPSSAPAPPTTSS